MPFKHAAHLTGQEHGDEAATTAAHRVIKALPREQLERHLFGLVHWPEAGGLFGTCRTCGSSVLVLDPIHDVPLEQAQLARRRGAA